MGLFQRTGRFFFEWRDKLPVPLALLMPVMARPRRVGWLLGLPLIFLGESLRLWAIRHIGPTTRTRDICADRLVTSGPYCCCRNPLYLANMLKISGIVAIAGSAFFAALVILFYALEFACIIPYEEQFLMEKFPEEFAAWRDRVPAILPVAGRKTEFDRDPAWSLAEAFRSEKKTFASTAALLVFLLGIAKYRGRAEN